MTMLEIILIIALVIICLLVVILICLLTIVTNAINEVAKGYLRAFK